MPEPESKSPLKNDFAASDRTLRSSSPAVKRPASDMGGQDREDVEMGNDDHSNGLNGSGTADSNNESPSKLSTSSASGKRARNDQSSNTTTNTTASSDGIVDANSSITSVSMPDVEAVPTPSIDEQVVKVTALAEATPKDGQRGYIVSGKWLRRVQARSSEPPKNIEKDAAEGEIGPVDNTDIALNDNDDGELKDEEGKPFVFLRYGLELNQDYSILPEKAWDLVIGWYGLKQDSPVITRFAHALSEDNPLEVQYELNPPIFSILKVIGTHTQQSQRDSDLPPKRLLGSIHTPFMTWLKQAKELLHIEMTTKVRAWRILGGLKSTSASGILTPAASRSSSPAPGAEITASAGSKMILDAPTFSALQLGEQRQMIDCKDQTANANYNGKIDLKMLGMGGNAVIVLEEQSSSDPDKFASENLKLSVKGSMKAKNLTVSGRSSPTPSIMTRGRTQREGRPKGIVGLTNLGNTCYMNSALQCIRSVKELTEYFLSQYYKKELNFDNPLGHNGHIATAYGNFIDSVYSSSTAFQPRQFKNTIGRYGPSFAGYGQQDSQEFLAFLLDGLQEDLNRIHKKPYIEKPDSTDDMVKDPEALRAFADRNWSDYKARNDSVITDLFVGMYKSTLTCPECEKVSIVFDPFSSLTLQLPIENNWSKQIIYFPLRSRPVKIDVDIDKNSSILDMKKFISQRTKCDPMRMIVSESYKNKFFKVFDNTDVIAETNISANDVICCYELEDTPTNYNPEKKKRFSIYTYSNKDADEKVDAASAGADKLLVPIYNRLVRPTGTNKRTFFAHPTYMVLSRKDRSSFDHLLRRVLTRVSNMTTMDILEDDEQQEINATPEDSDTLLVTDNDSNGSESPKATAASVQGEEGLVDVSMRDASQPPPEPTEATDEADLFGAFLTSKAPLSKRLQRLFDLQVAHTEEGIATGWNNISENTAYESLTKKAAQTPKTIAHRPARSATNDSESSADELAADQPDSQQGSETASEAGGSETQGSDNESSSLPDASDIVSGKDTRGFSKHQKKKTYRRKGRIIHGKAPRRTPPPPPQPRAAASSDEWVLPGDAIILDWNEDAYDALFEGSEDDADNMRGALTHRFIDVHPDEDLIARRARRSTRKKNGVTLEDCLNEYGKTETLSEQNAWYCPRCKAHRMADKQFELWRVPDILVMHLKRFSSSRNLRDKLDLLVQYPVEGLDLTKMVRDQSDGKLLIYDLIAVDNHYGGLGGGHYTAYARNFDNGQWYDYNDSHVSQVKDPENVVSGSAYLLFYRRRTTDNEPLGGPNLETVLAEVQSEDQQEQPATSREPSPNGLSGEGRRLGDSSHNGSSSASAGQAHRVGGGGDPTNQNQSTSLQAGLLADPSTNDALSSYQLALQQMSDNHGRGFSFDSDEPPAYEEDSYMDEGLGGPRIGPQLPSHNTNWADQSNTNWTDQSWGFMDAPPGSAAGDDEEGMLPLIDQRRTSVVSAGASSTQGLGGSVDGSEAAVSDVDVDAMSGSFEHQASGKAAVRNERESAPPPDHRQSALRIHQVPLTGDEEDDEMPVVELHPQGE